jgi:ferric-dicitrate binding protein FerR (iron transport regulator)
MLVKEIMTSPVITVRNADRRRRPADAVVGYRSRLPGRLKEHALLRPVRHPQDVGAEEKGERPMRNALIAILVGAALLFALSVSDGWAGQIRTLDRSDRPFVLEDGTRVWVAGGSAHRQGVLARRLGGAGIARMGAHLVGSELCSRGRQVNGASTPQGNAAGSLR